MAELRWNPLINDWVMIASHRQARPQMPKDFCPFCPGSSKVPEHFDVYKYDNDFPALSQNPPAPDDVATDFFRVTPAYGKCEVILYSPGHNITVPELSDEHMSRLVTLWQERFIDISTDEKIKYIYIFENRGEMVGVTMPHPHGQIYGYSVLPKKLELEMNSSNEYKKKNQSCLLCDMLKAEIDFKERIIFKNEHFTVFLPFFCEYPYGVYIISNTHKNYITEFNQEESFMLGITIRQTIGMFDSLFDMQFPYMMAMHNAPVNTDDNDLHFHIEFFPPMRSSDKQKFNASSETGAWAHCNPTCPEDAAKELLLAYKKFMEK